MRILRIVRNWIVQALEWRIEAARLRSGVLGTLDMQ